MSPILALFAVAVSQPAAIETAHQRLTEQLVGCGLGSNQISISYQNELQYDEVLVSGLNASTDPDVWACLARLQREGAIIAFDTTWGNRVLYEAYNRQFGEIDRAMARQLAQQWLDERGLFQDRPAFNSEQQSPEQYLRRVEHFCGLPVRTFVLADDHSLLFAAAPQDFSGTDERLLCFLYVLRSDDAADALIGAIGFVGNETSSVDAPRP